MPTKKRVLKNNHKKTLKDKVYKNIAKQDLWIEEGIVDRNIDIEQIYALYENIAEMNGDRPAYLEFVHNDLIGFTGLEISNKNINKETLTKILNKIPLYSFLSLLGFAYYRSKQ